MTETLFYHLERRSLDAILPGLIERTLERGWRAVIKTESAERADALDNLLWTYDDQTFLPHAQSGDGNPKRQPVLITVEDGNPNEAQVRFLVDGAELEDAAPYDRVVYVFDGHDEDAVSQARAEWQKAKAQGFSVSYWQQDLQGRWQQKA